MNRNSTTRPTEDASRAAIQERDLPFLEKVMAQGGLTDPYDARDITEVVFRVMRDLMTTEAADRVSDELQGDVLPNAEDRSLHVDLNELWKDTNPLVGFLSRVRPPWQGPGIFKIDSDRFIFRVANESGMPRDADPVRVIQAVFAATKDDLPEERIQEIASWMPDQVRAIWEQA